MRFLDLAGDVVEEHAIEKETDGVGVCFAPEDKIAKTLAVHHRQQAAAPIDAGWNSTAKYTYGSVIWKASSRRLAIHMPSGVEMHVSPRRE